MIYQLHLEIRDEDLVNDLRAYAAASELTISAATRILLKKALKEEAKP